MSNGWLEKYSFLSYNPKDFSCRLVLQPLLLAKILVYNAFVIHVAGVFITDLTLQIYKNKIIQGKKLRKNEKIQGNNLPKIEKIQGKKLKWMLLKGFRKLQKTAQICGDSG